MREIGTVSSIFLYSLIGMMTVRLAIRSMRCKRKTTCIVLMIILLSLLPSLRATSVGIDTALYMPRFEWMLAGGNASAMYGWGKGLSALINIVLKLTNSAQAVLIVASVITNTLIVCRLYEMRKVSFFPICIFIYYCTVYFYTYNIFRQMLAVALVFFATRYIDSKKYIRYAVLMLIAVTIHQSAVLGLAYIAISVLSWKRITNYRMIVVIAMLAMLPMILVGAFSIVEEKAMYYFETVSVNIGFMIFLKLILLVLSMCINQPKKKQQYSVNGHRDSATSEEGLMSDRSIVVSYIMGLAWTFIGGLFPYVDRLGLYFMLYEGVYWGNLYNKNRKNVLVIFFLMLSLMIYLLDLLGSGQGQVPYRFFFD